MLLPTLAPADSSSPTHTVGDGTGSRVTEGNHSIDDVNGSNTDDSIGDDGDDIINGGDDIDIINDGNNIVADDVIDDDGSVSDGNNVIGDGADISSDGITDAVIDNDESSVATVDSIIDGNDSIDTGFNDGERFIAVNVEGNNSVGDSADARIDEFEVNDDSIGDGVII